ncbi:MAG: AAA family ATPase, partial [Myxococcota bacterium]
MVRAYGQLHHGESRSAFELMGHMLGEDPVELRHALRPDGTLRRLGFLRTSRFHYRGSPFPMELHADVEDILLVPHESAEDLLVSFFRRGPRAAHDLSSFTHLRDDLDLLRRVMAGALRQEASGVHVLLYGPPGTGKTELCRALAEDLGATLFEIAVEGRDGDPLTGGLRSTAFRVCQHALARRRSTLVLFDEIEDVFAGRRAGRHHSLSGRPEGASHDVEKGWMNQLLEQSAVPSFWVTNAIDQLDPAFVRRFDLIVALPEPPVCARRQMAETHLAGLPLSEAFLDQLATDERLTPATLSTLRRVAELGGTDGQLESRLWRALAQRQRTLPHKPRLARSTSPLSWDGRFLNTDPPMEPVIRALAAQPQGRVLLHGLPGTGKTELVHEVARRSGVPLMVRSASDLLSKWVGDNEANIAKMFHEAADQGCILLLDEADSFFR